jgi:hemolysin III
VRFVQHFREPINTLTHGFGVLIGVVLAAAFILRGQIHPTLLIFALSLVVLYTASSLYHGLRVSNAWVTRLKKLDHSAIFVLIAGTYTPVLWVGLPDPWRWVALTAIWGTAIIGIALKFSLELPEWVSLSLYVALGWVAVMLLPTFVGSLPRVALIALITGGVFYTLGVPFFASRRKHHLLPGWGTHEIWHLFVLAGSVAHVVMVLSLPLA